MKLRKIAPIACIALSTLAIQALPVQSGGSGMSMNHASKHRRFSRQGLRILAQIEQARQSIAANQTQTAMEHIQRALAERSQLAMTVQKAGQPILVPLYWEMDETSVLGPVLAARSDGGRQPSKSAPITVEEAGTQYTFVGLDLNKVERRLVAAQTALKNNDPKSADASLRHIGDELVVLKVKDEFPLLAARENLGLAEIAIRSGHYKEAAAALQQASITLGQYASESSAHRPYEAKGLSQQIDALSKTVQQNHAGAADRIAGWWEKVNQWFTHPIHD